MRTVVSPDKSSFRIRCNNIRNVNVGLSHVVHKVREQELDGKSDHFEYLLIRIAYGTNCIKLLVSNLAAFLDQRLRKANDNRSLRVR
jgi:hypothetical protein